MQSMNPAGSGPDAATVLADLDADGDGSLTAAEFQVGRPPGPPPGGPPPDQAAAEDEDSSTLQSILLAAYEDSFLQQQVGILA